MIDTRRANFAALPAILRCLGPDAKLRKTSDKQYFAKCPFHDDSTASLSLTMRPERGWVWNCFGCGESGDGVAFVMKAQGIGFKAAVALLDDGSAILPHIPEVPRKAFALVCDACRSEFVDVDVRDIAWLADKWEIAPDGVGAVCPKCLARAAVNVREAPCRVS